MGWRYAAGPRAFFIVTLGRAVTWLGLFCVPRSLSNFFVPVQSYDYSITVHTTAPSVHVVRVSRSMLIFKA